MGFFSSRLRRRLRRSATTSLITLGLAGVALGNPSGATVRHGQVNISPGVHAQIQQLTDKAIVDWQSFSIGPNESVRILQPGALSVLLNRVTGVDPSTILGSLEANGNVWLINPNGILFGPGSTVNVGGLVASTLDLSNQDFLSGNYNFQLAGPDLGAVVNQGRIKITDGGYAVLTGPSVLNEGTIVAKSGTIVLAAGEQATLNFDGRDLVSFAIGQSAGNGTVLLAPGMMSDTLAETFGVSSALRADQLVRDADGSVRLVNSSGTLIQAGEVSVDGQAGQDAGTVLLHSADVTVLADGSTTSASGQGADSNGGDIYVLSFMDASASERGFTDVGRGSLLSATGGTSGDGGFIEVSGDRLNLHGEIDLSANDGKSGDFLLDPVVVTIVNGNQMPTDTTDPIQLTTTTVIGDDWLESLNLTNLTIESAGDIIFDIDPIDGILDFRPAGRVDNLTLTAGTGELGGIFLGDDGTSILGLTNLTLNTVDAGGGDINLGNATVVLSGALDINSSGNINLSTSVLNLSSNNSRGSAPLSISAAGDLNMGSADIDVFNNFAGSEDLLIEAGGNLDLGMANLTYNVATQNDPVTTTIRAGGNITSSGGNLIDVSGATLIEGDTVSLGDTDITVDNASNNNARLTVNSRVGALDLSGGTLNITGATTLTSATTMDLSSLSLTGITGNLRSDVLIDSEGDLNMVDTQITTRGNLAIDGEGDVTFGELTVLNLLFNAAKGSTPLTISAAGDLDLANADIDVFNNFAGNEDLLIEAGGNLDLGTADLTYDVATQNDAVTTTIRAGGDITSSGGNVIDVAGATIIEGDAVSLADADITVDNASNTNARLTVNSRVGALDLSGGTLNVTGATTLTSATTTDLSSLSLTGITGSLRSDVLIDSEGDLNMVDTQITTRGNLAIDGEGDVTFGELTVLNLLFNAAKGSTPLTISAAGDLDLANADIDVFNNFAGNEDLLIEAGGNLDLGTADLTYDVATQNDAVTTTIRADGDITSSGGNVIDVAGATLIEGDAVSLADADITVDNASNTNARLTVNSRVGALDLSGGTLRVTGATTLASATTMDLSSMSLTGTNGSLRSDVLIDSENNLNMVDTQITTGGRLEIDGEANITLGPASVINLGSNNERGTTPLSISAVGDLALGNTDIDVFNNFSGNEDLLIEAGGDLNLGTADLTYNVTSQNDTVTTTIRAGGEITSAGGNVIDVAGATLIEGDAVSLADADITVDNASNTNARLTVNSRVGALDLSAGTLRVTGATTLTSATTMNLSSMSLTGTNGSLRSDVLIDSENDLNMVDTQITTGGRLEIDGEADVTFGPSTVLNLLFNASKGSTPLTISSAGDLELGNADIDVFNNFSGDEDLLIEAGGNLNLGTADLTYDVTAQNDTVTTTIRAGGNIASSGGNVIDVAGATLIEGDAVSLADADITIDHAGTDGSGLTVNATLSSLDISGGALIVSGPTTLTSATTMNLSAMSLAGNNNGGASNLLVDSEGDLNLLDTSITTTGSVEIDGEANITFGPASVINLGSNNARGATPLVISAVGNLDLGNTDIDVFNNFSGNEDLLIEAGGNLDLGSADLTYDVTSQIDTVTTTIRAGGDITSSGGNVIDVAGATLIEGDAVSLSDADITVDNASNNNARLTVNSRVGALDLSGGTLNVTGATTLTSATTTDLSSLSLTGITGNLRSDVLIDSEGDLNMVDTQITTRGNLAIDGEGDVTFGELTVLNLLFNAAKGSTPLTISAAGDLDLANADIDVFNNFAGNEDLLIEAGGNLDLGTADLTYDVATQNDAVTTTIRAGGDITSSGGNVIDVAGATLIEGDAVSLADADITVDNASNTNARLTVNSRVGALDLSGGTLNVTGATTLTSSTTTDLSSLSLTGITGSLRSDVLIDSEGNLNMVDTQITTRGNLAIDGEGDVTFGDLTVLDLLFNDAKGSAPLTISAAGDLDLANADIDVFNNFSGDEDLLIEAGGTLDLGTADLTYDVATATNNVTTTIRAGGSITSESNPDTAPNSFNNVFDTVGATVFEAGTGDIQLFDARIGVDQSGATSSTLNLTSEQGRVVLGESSLSTLSDIVFLADTLDAGSAQVATPNRVTLAISSGVDADDSQFDVGDIEIFGSTLGVLDPSKAVAGDVRLDLSQSGNTDISVLAEGDVEINHTGTGSVTLERAGLEGPPTGPASTSVASLTGDVFITSAGTVFIGSVGDTSPDELVNGAGTVRIDANTITDRHTGGVDVVAGETLELITDNSLATSANPLEVQAPGLLLDLSRTANNQGYVNVAGDVEFLQVIGRSSNIRVTELASGANLTALRDGTGTSSLNLGSTAFENIDYVDFNTIRLDTLNVGPTQSMSVKSVNGDIVDDSAGDNAILEGGLLLTAENGSIGSAANPISVNGGVLAVEAGNDIFIQGSGDDLRIGQVEVVNTTVNAPVASGAGMVAGGDIQIAMPGTAQTLLTQEADITSAGGIAIVLENGDFQQTGGTVRADNVALQIGRNAGQFDGTDVLSEISVEADNLVVDVNEDAILSQTNGDLTLTDQLTIGGATYSTTGAGGDLRVRVTDGDLNIDTDLSVGEQAALLTGDNDVVGQGNLPNSINLNGSINAGQSLVLISQGDINQLSGTLTAPSIGLGANGIIGSAANPIQLSTSNLAVNPFEAQVNDPDGFTTVSSVSAVGATVNQGVPLPPEPPTPEPEVPVTPVEIPPSAFQEPQDFIFEEDLVQSEFFSQNQTALVEELLDMLMDPEFNEIDEIDPTRIPVIDDEDFLQKKFRR